MSTIIATMCAPDREHTLRRAIDSALDQEDVDPEVIVVVNGNRSDARIVDAIRADRRIRVIVDLAANLSGAWIGGRRAVTGEFFGFLDDDDELLPGGLAARVGALLADPTADFAMSPGYGWWGDGMTPSPAFVRAMALPDRFLALVEENYMASCCSTFRSSVFDADALWPLARYRYREWTGLAFELMNDGRRFAAVHVPTFRVNESPTSMSKSSAYMTAEFDALELMLSRTTHKAVRAELRRKLTAATHTRSDEARRHGRLAEAWHWHLRTLRLPGGLLHLPYTRRLLLPWKRGSTAAW